MPFLLTGGSHTELIITAASCVKTIGFKAPGADRKTGAPSSGLRSENLNFNQIFRSRCFNDKWFTDQWKSLIQAKAVNKWESRHCNPGSVAPEPTLTTPLVASTCILEKQRLINTESESLEGYLNPLIIRWESLADPWAKVRLHIL